MFHAQISDFGRKSQLELMVSRFVKSWTSSIGISENSSLFHNKNFALNVFSASCNAVRVKQVGQSQPLGKKRRGTLNVQAVA